MKESHKIQKEDFSWEYSPENNGSFEVQNAENLPVLSFPLMNSFGMKSFVTPELKGDIVSSFHNYLTAATVTEELHRNISSRNFWIKKENQNPWSATGNSVYQKSQKWTENHDKYSIKGQFGAFETLRINETLGFEVKITVFVPETDDFLELLKISVKNISQKLQTFSGTYAIPIFGRSADNFRDHRQVTTMFQENFLEKNGVRIKPKIVHDEKGHSVNKTNYIVLGFDNQGKAPDDIWIRLHDFIGQGGSLDNPKAVFDNSKPPVLSAQQANASEAIAALRFNNITLESEQITEFVIVQGITDNSNDILKWKKLFGTPQKADEYLLKTKNYWQEKADTVSIKTADPKYDNWTKWISYQIKCRQIFGNSFLPDFGYGRGGRGWRDLWQDLLSIFLVDPQSAKEEMLNNFKGIRIDGSNATIIGTKPGEFLADRNNIPRTWSDHGAWPVFILNFYINQTGDYDILFDEISYWKDKFSHRSKKIDEKWSASNGFEQKDLNNNTVKGSIFEHVLLQQLSAFYNIGEHNILLLEGADWNDTYDMADKRGESVCFYSFYSFNLKVLADLLIYLEKNGLKEIEIQKEVLILLDKLKSQNSIDYNSISQKKELLLRYFDSVENNISNQKIKINIGELIFDLNTKSEHISENILKQEWLETKAGHKFFNGHYDNIGEQIGGDKQNGIMMDLTSQVIPIICEVSDKEHTQESYNSIKAILKDKNSYGLRLTTEFKEINLNIGRITGFVYGHKEHGSKWMQQNIMLAYGLYKQGFVDYGYEVMNDVYKLANNQNVAKIFPGLPSFFNAEDKGEYAYLTGSSSWYLLTLTTQIFGIRGEKGNLCLNPKLSIKQFDQNKQASIKLNFMNKKLNVTFINPKLLNYNEYKIREIKINDKIIDLNFIDDKSVIIEKKKLTKILLNEENIILVELNK